MTTIPEEIKKLFYHNRDIGECSLLAFYEDHNNYSFIYEENGIPYVYCCDRKGNNCKSAQIPNNLPNTMEKLNRLEKENERLKEDIEKRKKE